MSINSASMLALIGLLSLLCQWGAWKLKIPAILPLLLVGIALGPVSGVLDPDALFGELLFPMVQLAVAIILFEGALTLDKREIRGHGKMVRNLISSGMLVTWVVIAVAARVTVGLSWPMAFLLGALLVVTGPTVIAPMLRSIRPTPRVASILRWEGILIDPLGALLALLVYEFVVAAQGQELNHALRAFTLTLLVGFSFGYGAARLIESALTRNWLPHYLHNFGVMTFMLAIYALSNALAHESGLLTVTVMGVVMANRRRLALDSLLEFKETLSVLLISALFIILAARLDVAAMAGLGPATALLVAVVLLVARPLSIWVSAWGTDLNLKEKLLLSWIAPRGIVAAAVTALFAIRLEQHGWAEASLLVPLVFIIIITTVVVQGLTAKLLARKLGLRERKPDGLLLFGANPLARELAQQLQQAGVKVLLADPSWENIRAARMASLPTYFGNPASEHAANAIEMAHFGRLLVLSPYRQLNPQVLLHFRDWLGEGNVFGLTEGEQQTRASHRAARAYAQRLVLFGEGQSYGRLAQAMADGAKIKATSLSDSFTFDAYVARHGERAVPLLAINERGYAIPFVADSSLKPGPGWTIISLLLPVVEAPEAQPLPV